MPGVAGEAAQVLYRHLCGECRASGAAAVVTDIVIGAVIGTVADAVGFAGVMVGAVVCAVADTVQATGLVVAAIVCAMAACRAAMA